jgi:ElaB/YqjD/DUF883 family membrane-anchored ribosome-binding protein
VAGTTLGELLALFDASTGATVFGLGVLASLVAWRWLVARDRRVDEDRDRRASSTGDDIRAVRDEVRRLIERVEHCATEEELRAVERDVAALKSDVRANMIEVRGELSRLNAQIEGQRDILSRIDEYLRARP